MDLVIHAGVPPRPTVRRLVDAHEPRDSTRLGRLVDHGDECVLIKRDHAVVMSKDSPHDALTVARADVAGVESPAVLTHNYFADAWKDGREQAAAAIGKTADELPRDAIALAINSAQHRSQDRLHIHADQLDPRLGADLKRQLDAGQIVAGEWRPLEPVHGHRYQATWVQGEELTVNPFRMVAERLAAQHGRMAENSIAVVAETDLQGRRGFIVIYGRGPAEEWLQGHTG